MQFSLASLLLLTTAVAVTLGLGVWRLIYQTAGVLATGGSEVWLWAGVAVMAGLVAAVIHFGQ